MWPLVYSLWNPDRKGVGLGGGNLGSGGPADGVGKWHCGLLQCGATLWRWVGEKRGCGKQLVANTIKMAPESNPKQINWVEKEQRIAQSKWASAASTSHFRKVHERWRRKLTEGREKHCYPFDHYSLQSKPFLI